MINEANNTVGPMLFYSHIVCMYNNNFNLLLLNLQGYNLNSLEQCQIFFLLSQEQNCVSQYMQIPLF